MLQCALTSLKKVDTLEVLRQSSPSAEGPNRVSQNCSATELWPVAGSSAVRVTPIPQYSTVESVRTVRITGAGTSAGTCRFRRWDMHSALIDAVLVQSSPSTGIPGYAQFRNRESSIRKQDSTEIPASLNIVPSSPVNDWDSRHDLETDNLGTDSENRRR